jgi:c-di-GMP-binding flagellar brake protein YcgR
MSTINNDTILIAQPLKLWEKLLIMVGNGPDAGTYVGRIEDFIDSSLLVTAPDFIAGKTLLRDDLVVTVQITRDDAVYQFESQIRRHGRSGGNVLLAAPRNFRRVQRRLFVRIEWREDIEYALVSDLTDWEFFPKSLTWHRTVTHDFSGGGVRLSAATPVPAGSVVLLCWLKRPRDAFPDYTFAICRRIWDEAGAVHSGLEFILDDQLGTVLGEAMARKIPTEARRFDRAVQNKLVVWIFHRQIELRQKGLL